MQKNPRPANAVKSSTDKSAFGTVPAEPLTDRSKKRKERKKEKREKEKKRKEKKREKKKEKKGKKRRKV